MIGHAVLTFYRVATRHPLYAALDLLGLSLGIAVFVILSLYIRFETGFEHWLSGADKVYEVQTRYTMPGQPQRSSEGTTAVLLGALHDDFPDLEGVRIHSGDVAVHKGEDVMREQEALVDSGFLTLFHLELIAGDPSSALSDPGSVLLSDSMARKYLHPGQGIGSTIRLSDEEGSNLYTVTGILKDLPRDTDLKFDIVRPLTPAVTARPDWQKWGRMPVHSFVRLDDPALAQRLDAAFDAFSDRRLGNQGNGQPMHNLLTWRLAPLRSLHLSDPRSQGALITLGAVALLALLVAAMNHVNLATALAGLRAREVAVRRSVGATRRLLVGQFLIEALLTALVAWTGGMAIVELVLPIVDSVTGLPLAIPYEDDILFMSGLLAAVVLAGLLSGLYPALLLSQFQPARIMASARASSGGRVGFRIREALVVAQFSVVVVLFVLTWGFFSEIRYLHKVDLGFRRDGLLISVSTRNPAVTPALQQQIWTAFRNVPGVTSVGFGEEAPGDEEGVSHVVATAPGRQEEVSLVRSAVEGDFFSTYGATLLAGRFLSPESAVDDKPSDDAAPHIVLNDKAAALLGFRSPEDAVGKTLSSYGKPLEIVGVVGNLHFRSPRTELAGIYYYRGGKDPEIAAIRYHGAPEPEMREALTRAWRGVVPDIPLELISAAGNLDHFYRPDRDRSRLFAIGAIGAAMIGCLGLYGIAVYSTSRRGLEVAIRKVLGAPRKAVVKLLIGQFLWPVLIANLLAWPISYVALSTWLQQFNDRIEIGVLPFAASSAVALTLALLTVTAHALKAARAAPGKALRSE